MPSYHVNPATGNPGPCRAEYSCPFGSLSEDHYPTLEAARESYEKSQGNSFAPQAVPPAADTPTDSYLDGAGAREMWARGAMLKNSDSPPRFNLRKPLGTSQGFLAGSLYNHQAARWESASFTPDGRLAFVDTNNFYNSGPKLAIKRWDDKAHDWVSVVRDHGSAEMDIATTLREHGYETTSTGMIAAGPRKKYRKELSQAGEARRSSGSVNTTRYSPRPAKL